MLKKLLLTFIAGLFFYFSAYTQEINEAFVEQHYRKIETQIPMRDGTKLFTAIYIPKDESQKYPILLNRTPYTVSPYGKDRYKKSLGTFPEMTRAGYIFVYQDVRGQWMSEGNFENVRPTLTKANKLKIDESTDTYDTIDWLIKNIKNNNGKVGMYGISYPGFYATAGLVGSHPALKAVSPQAPVTDWFRGDDFRHGGALFLMDAFRFMYTFDAKRSGPILPEAGHPGFKLATKDFYSFFLNMASLEELQQNYLGHTVKFWKDLQKHQTLDTFWNSRLITHHLNTVKPAVMVVGGTFDAEDTYGAFETYRQIEKRNPTATNTLVIGPWYHGGWARSDGDFLGDIRFGEKTSLYYQQQLELPFFEYYLKGKGSFKPAEATVFFSGENKWRTFQQWPPKEIHADELYLHAHGRLDRSPNADDTDFVEYTADPNKPVPFQEGVITDRTREYMVADQRFVANRPDVMVFETAVLQEDLTLAGPIVADLQVSMTGTDADFIVKIIDVYPDTTTLTSAVSDRVVMQGYQMLVRGDVLRGRFREGMDTPKPFEPNKVTSVQVNLPDVAHTFKKGHKLMVQIQHTWFPLLDRNPNQFIDIFKAKKEDFIPNTHRIYFSKEKPSRIMFGRL
ncbi:CocE/NonD family hydrolase [Sphingobacterium sp. Mn56C]|uniref:CocE/NonD family hydrolase n=1 Tax=Sphingobacterium sp. Mn56C TaxID=3395261 RepID=UPI003BE8F32E